MNSVDVLERASQLERGNSAIEDIDVVSTGANEDVELRNLLYPARVMPPVSKQACQQCPRTISCSFKEEIRPLAAQQHQAPTMNVQERQHFESGSDPRASTAHINPAGEPTQVRSDTIAGTPSEQPATASSTAVAPYPERTDNPTTGGNASDNAPSPEGKRTQDETGDDEYRPRPLKVVDAVVDHFIVIVIFLLRYSRAYDFERSGDSDEAIEQQRGAEQGTAGVPTEEIRGPESSKVRQIWAAIKWGVMCVPDIILKFVVRWTLKLIWRLVRASSLFGYPFEWIEWQVTKNHSPEILMTAFGLANFVTAAIYYLLLFDAKGTVAPSWANIFG